MSDQAADVPTAPRRPGRKPKLDEANQEHLRQLVLANPMASLEETSNALAQVTGIRVDPHTIRLYLRRMGLVRVKPARLTGEAAQQSEAEAAAQGKKRYGYADWHRDPGDAVRYPSGLTDAEWALVSDLFEVTGPGKPPTYPRRMMVDACLYVVRTGSSWRMLPKNFPPWQDVYATFRRWTHKRLFEQMHNRLREMWRQRAHRDVAPTKAILDSQSVKTGPEGGPKGYDAGKKVKGRKRHIVTDTMGLLLAVLVSTANVQDRDGAGPAVARAMARYPTIETVYADSGYAGKRAADLAAQHGIKVEIVRRNTDRQTGRWVDPQGQLFPTPARFVVLPKRWIVERTHAWNERPRRMAKDHDRLISVSESWIWMVEARLLLRRLTASPAPPPQV